MPSIDILTSPVPYRVLIVDDDPQLNAMLRSIMEQSGWHVVTAHSVAEAAPVVEDRSQPLDLCLIDLRLPDGDGMSLIPKAQARRQPPDVVIMTGFPSDQAYIEAIRLGVLDVLLKPFTASDVGAMLRARAVRERQRLGLIVERFERVDQEIEAVQGELKQIREILANTWDTAAKSVARIGRGTS
jgi:DNA-binding response OmpR family regulator